MVVIDFDGEGPPDRVRAPRKRRALKLPKIPAVHSLPRDEYLLRKAELEAREGVRPVEDWRVSTLEMVGKVYGWFSHFEGSALPPRDGERSFIVSYDDDKFRVSVTRIG